MKAMTEEAPKTTEMAQWNGEDDEQCVRKERERGNVFSNFK